MRKKHLTIIGAALITFCQITFPLCADTLSPKTMDDTPAAVAHGTDSSARGDANLNATPAATPLPQHGAKADTMSHRDSTLRNVLATLAQEDSPTAIVRSAPAPATVPDRTHKNGRVFRIVLMMAGHRLWLPIMIVSVILIILIAVIVPRLSGKRAEKRFMTTTRLSLMNGEVQRACLYIEKHFAAPDLTPGGLCTALVTGRPFLEALFQRELGMSIADYIAQVRVHRARHFVRMNPMADAAQVAFHVGIPEAKEFAEIFEKVSGKKFEEAGKL